MSVANAMLIIGAATHNGVAIANLVGFACELQQDDVEIPDTGVYGPSAQGTVRRRLIAEIEWLDGAPIALGTTGSLVITINTKGGGTKVHTLTTMKAGSAGFSTAQIPMRYRQQFAHEGDMSSNPWSIA